MRILSRGAWAAALSEAVGRTIGSAEMGGSAEDLDLDELSRLRFAAWYDALVPGYDALGGAEVFVTRLADLYVNYTTDVLARSWHDTPTAPG